MPKFIPQPEMRKARDDLDIYGTCMLKVGDDGRTVKHVPLKDYLIIKADDPLHVTGSRSFTLPGGIVVVDDKSYKPVFSLEPGTLNYVDGPVPPKPGSVVKTKPLTGHDVFKPVDFHEPEVDAAHSHATGGLRHPMDCRCRDCHPEWYRSVPKGKLSKDVVIDVARAKYGKDVGVGGFSQAINPKDAAGSKKVAFRYILWAPLILVMRALKNGAQKYGPFNWRTGPKISRVTYVEAAIRHLAADLDGETIDPESGELRTPHIAAAIAGLMVALDAESVGQLEDDRGTPGNVADMIRAETKQ